MQVLVSSKNCNFKGKYIKENTIFLIKSDTAVCLHSETSHKWCSGEHCRLKAKWHINSPPPLLTVAHPYSGCHWLGYYAHKKQCIFRALLNSANLAAHWHIWQIWAFQSSSLPSRGVLGLNYLTFGTALQKWGERKGGRGLCRDT